MRSVTLLSKKNCGCRTGELPASFGKYYLSVSAANRIRKLRPRSTISILRKPCCFKELSISSGERRMRAGGPQGMSSLLHSTTARRPEGFKTRRISPEQVRHSAIYPGNVKHHGDKAAIDETIPQRQRRCDIANNGQDILRPRLLRLRLQVCRHAFGAVHGVHDTMIARYFGRMQAIVPRPASQIQKSISRFQGERLKYDQRIVVPVTAEAVTSLGPGRIVPAIQVSIHGPNTWGDENHLVFGMKFPPKFVPALRGLNSWMGLVSNAAAWIPGLHYIFKLRNSRKRRNPAILSTPGLYTAPPGMTTVGTIVFESGRC